MTTTLSQVADLTRIPNIPNQRFIQNRGVESIKAAALTTVAANALLTVWTPLIATFQIQLLGFQVIVSVAGTYGIYWGVTELCQLYLPANVYVPFNFTPNYNIPGAGVNTAFAIKNLTAGNSDMACVAWGFETVP